MPSTTPAAHTFPLYHTPPEPHQPHHRILPPSVWHSSDVASLPFLDALHLPALQGQVRKTAGKEEEEEGEGEGEEEENDDDNRPRANSASVWADARADREDRDGPPLELYPALFL